MNPARTLGPDIVANNFTGWWCYVGGDLLGAAIAVALIGLVRGAPDKAEIEAAEGGGGCAARPCSPCPVLASGRGTPPPATTSRGRR